MDTKTGGNDKIGFDECVAILGDNNKKVIVIKKCPNSMKFSDW